MAENKSGNARKGKTINCVVIKCFCAPLSRNDPVNSTVHTFNDLRCAHNCCEKRWKNLHGILDCTHMAYVALDRLTLSRIKQHPVILCAFVSGTRRPFPFDRKRRRYVSQKVPAECHRHTDTQTRLNEKCIHLNYYYYYCGTSGISRTAVHNERLSTPLIWTV